MAASRAVRWRQFSGWHAHHARLARRWTGLRSARVAVLLPLLSLVVLIRGATSASTNEGESSTAPSLGMVLERLGKYALQSGFGQSTAGVASLLNAGDAWGAMERLAGVLGVNSGSPSSIERMGVLRALVEVSFLQLTLSMNSRVLLADGKNINEGDPNRWKSDLAGELRALAAVLPNDRFVTSAGYVALYWLMTSNLKPDRDGMVRLESYSSMSQAWWLGRQAQPAHIGRLCEIGFNAGHSALALLLSAPPTATMVSFDLGSKSYTAPCASFIGDVFPGRHELVVGPSNETVLRYVRENIAKPRCDLLYIDGGHEVEEAEADLLAGSLLSVAQRTVLVMDDVGCGPDFCQGPGAAWRAFKEAGRIRELGCEAEVDEEAGVDRRWCWGIYL
eukprot:TRINITY_DN17848_c0_g2_i1.p1 TRINITY_DN17848_c0_g2~~TRINITY_DN17848_c0_g2_i1.p1  ORF type:complete len:401 (-),score=73.68 TRINITY_DN17848_c0_g2_i1:145-1317(-)